MSLFFIIQKNIFHPLNLNPHFEEIWALPSAFAWEVSYKQDGDICGVPQSLGGPLGPAEVCEQLVAVPVGDGVRDCGQLRAELGHGDRHLAVGVPLVGLRNNLVNWKAGYTLIYLKYG